MNKYTTLESTIRALGAKSASQPLEKDMNDQVHAGSYSSKHFEVSRDAQKLFASLPKSVDSDKAEKSLQLHDKLFAIHKKTKASNRSTQRDVESAQQLHDQIMSLAKEMGLEDRHGHVKDSLDFITQNLDAEGNVKDDINPDDVAKRFGTPPKDYQSDVKSDADIDNMAKFHISRDKRAQRKLKIIDDQYIPGVTEMDRIEKVSPSFLEALKQVQANAQELEEKKKMTKADIAGLRDPKGSIDANDLAALRAGEHKKKKVAEEKEESEAEEKEEKSEKKHNNTPEGIECPVCGMKACPTVKEEAEEVDEAVRSLARASRTWASTKTSADIAKKLSKKGFRDPDTPSKAEMRKKGEDALKAYMAKGGKIRKEEVENLDEVTASIDHTYVSDKWGQETGKVKKILDSLEKAKISHSVSHSGDDKTYVTSDHPKFASHMEKLAKKADTYDPKIYVHGVKEEVEALDEAQFIVIQKGMNKKRIRNNPAEIMQARKDGWAINEEVEELDEANELQNIAKSQKAATIKREVQQKKQMFAKKDAVDKQKFSKSMQNIKAGDEVEVDGEQIDELKKAALMAVRNRASGRMMDDPRDEKAHKVEKQASSRLKKITDAEKEDSSKRAYKDYKESFMERAIAILGEEFANASYEELAEEIVKRGRGRPRKDGSTGPKPVATGPKRGRGRPRKDAAPAAASSSSADTDKDREHIVMGLRKAVSLRGEHGVKFADGSVHKIPAEHAQKALKMHDSLSRPSEKMTFARKLAASHDSFKRALSDKNPGSEETKKTGITLAKRAD